MTISFSIYDACYRERAKCNKTARPAVLGIITTQSLGPPLVTYDARYKKKTFEIQHNPSTSSYYLTKIATVLNLETSGILDITRKKKNVSVIVREVATCNKISRPANYSPKLGTWRQEAKGRQIAFHFVFTIWRNAIKSQLLPSRDRGRHQK
jgi:hypothetical protein